MQLYGNEASFYDALEGFVVGGLQRGEAVIVIATAAHRRELESRLRQRGDVELELAAIRDQFIAVDAEQMLAEVTVERDGWWPDDQRFERAIGGLLVRARWGGRRVGDATGPSGERPVRAFGEMVALLWAKGCSAATLRLEQLWNRFRESGAGADPRGGGGFPLFCAYPRAGFTPDDEATLRDVCATHTQFIAD